MRTVDFLHLLYGDQSGWLETHARHEGAARTSRPYIIPMWFYLPDDYEDMDYMLSHADNPFSVPNRQGYGLHRSIGLHRFDPSTVYCDRCGHVHNVRPCDDSVGTIGMLVADFDKCTVEEALAALADFEHEPTVIAVSGGGIHAYWKLTQPLDVTTHDGRDTYRAHVKGLARFLETNDESVASISQTIRLPGFVNMKPARNGARCEVIEVSGRVYRIEQFAAYALELHPYKHYDLPALPDDLRGKLPQSAIDYLQHGEARGNRNNRLFVVARHYNDARYTLADAERDLLPRALADGLQQRSALATIRKAFTYQPSTPSLPPRMLRALAARKALER